MVLAATREGFASARRAPGVAVTLWLVNLALALSAGVPAFLALRSAIGELPGADALASGFDVGILLDLAETRPGLLGGLALSAAGVAFLGLLAGAAATGGALEVLSSRADGRPFGHRFGRGAGRFFLRFARAGLLAGVGAILAAALVAGPLVALSVWMRHETGAEVGSAVVALCASLLAGVVVLVFLLALDAVRIGIVREDARRVLPLLGPALAVVVRHPLAWLGTWALNAALWAVALSVYLAVRRLVPAGTGPLVLAMALAQQAFVLARAWLRVALLGSEMALVEAAQSVPEPDRPLA